MPHGYDICSRLQQVAAPLGNLTKVVPNSTGQVTPAIGPRNQITRFGYSLTDLSSLTEPSGGPPLGNTVTYVPRL